MGALLAALLLAAPAFAQDTEHRFPIPGRGSLVLKGPESWVAISRQIPQPPSVTGRLGPRTGNAFSVQITAIWLDETRRATQNEARSKAFAEESAAKQLAQAEETEVKVLELRGKETAGHYYSLTARGAARGASDLRHLTQGTLRVGETLVVFTLLQREADAKEREAVLRALTDANFVKATAEEVAASTGRFRFDMPEPRLRITIPDLPQFALRIHPNAALVPHNRFFGDGPDGYSLSILLPTADAGMGALECARSIFGSLVKRYELDPKFVVTHRSNDRTFVMLFPHRAGPIVQLKAYLLSGTGTHCVEVHVSNTLTAASKEAGADAIAAWFQGFRQATIESY